MRTFNKSEQLRTYNPKECVTFRKTKEEFGGLSNMSGGYPLCVNGILIPTAESLYQACRFPHKPEVQELIIDKKSPMTAKMVSKPHRKETRPDWYQIRVRVMRWCLRVKLIMHWPEFSNLLLSTDDKPIVEDSHKDDFWGAKKKDDGTLVGMNVLGRLLMELREELRGPDKEGLHVLAPPPIKNFLLLGKQIEQISFKTGEDAEGIDPDLKKEEGTLWSIIKPEDSAKKSFDELEKKQIPAVQVAEQHKDIKDSRMKYPKRLIEVDLPIKRISAHARRDKNKPKGHLHTMHIWWATRPLASCRAVLMATMLPDPADEDCPKTFTDTAQKRMRSVAKYFCSTRKGQDELIIDLKKDLSNKKKRKAAQQEAARRYEQWESLYKKHVWTLEMVREALLHFIAWGAGWEQAMMPTFLENARALIQAAHESLDGEKGSKPLVLDPFAGAGSIPFEALRIGANSFASDLNPIAVLLNKVSQQYLPKYGVELPAAVEKWGKWVLEQARKKLAPYYPTDSNGNIPLAYIWARTITCEGPGCGAEVPLLGMLWLSHKKGNMAALRYRGDKKTKQVHIQVFKPKSESDLPSPISKRFAATCPCCDYTTPYKRVREQIRARNGGAHDSRLLAVIMLGLTGTRSFRTPDENDIKIAERAAKEIKAVRAAARGSLNPVPDEPYPDWYSGVFNPGLWNVRTWGDLFTPRQAVALTTFVQTVREVRERVSQESGDKGFADAVGTCIGLAVSNLSHYLSSVSIYALDHIISAFVQGSGMAMRPDFAEANPLMPKLVGGFDYALGQMLSVLEREAGQPPHGGTVQQSSATRIPLPDDSLAYLITDPPYYAAVPYSDLSDYCYVWLKRMLRDVHPDLLQGELTPKDDELVAYYVQPTKRAKKDSSFFEKKMQEALADCRRVLQPGGVAVVIFAHKGTAGWEALLNALVNAGWTVTASWPIDTERAARMRAKDSAVLASSIHLVCRPRENPDGSLRIDDIGDWRDVLQELPKRIHEWMPRLAEEGVVGADAIFACLGPALEIFSQYSYVEKVSGKKVPLKEYLEHVWAAVEKEALNMIFEGADAAGFEEDSRLTTMWLWTLSTGANNGNGEKEGADEKPKKSPGYTLEYDAARRIAQGLGAHLENLGRVVEIKGDKARLLSVAERTKYLFGKDESQAPVGIRKRKDSQMQLDFMAEVQKAEREEGGWGEKSAPRAGDTALDQLHQAMILFAAGRGEAMKRFLVEEGIGRDGRFWRLAQALSALYPSGTDEKRWVDGVLARKKSLGF